MCDASRVSAKTLAGASFAIWTTTPWTIPANLAVAVNEKLEYALVRAEVRVRVRVCVCVCVIFKL